MDKPPPESQLLQELRRFKKEIEESGLIYEDDLPEDMTEAEYADWFAKSNVDYGVRMGPPFTREVKPDYSDTNKDSNDTTGTAT